MIEYYKKRAEEYEKIYQKPERQLYIEEYKDYLTSTFKGRKILELACGTGFWTQFISNSAVAIRAIDINEEVINVAKSKDYNAKCNVEFSIMDYKDVSEYKNFDAVFVGFLVSHLTIMEFSDLLEKIIDNTLTNTKVIIMDNCYVEGESTNISRTDSRGNTYQTRVLSDGSEHEIMKNFFPKSDVLKLIESFDCEYQYISNKHFWSLEINT